MPIRFHNNHGKNIGLCNDNVTARRTASYNQAVVISDCTLPRKQLFEVGEERIAEMKTEIDETFSPHFMELKLIVFEPR